MGHEPFMALLSVIGFTLLERLSAKINWHAGDECFLSENEIGPVSGNQKGHHQAQSQGGFF